jgi:MFS family permease
LSFVRRTPAIYLPTLLIGLVAAFGMNFSVWVPLLAKQDLGVGAGVGLFPILILMAILAGLGFSMTTTSAMANTRIQAIAPDPLRGRVMSVYTTIFAGTGPFGALLAGGIANGIGTPGSLAICGAATVGSVALIAVIGHIVGVPVMHAPRSAALEPGD